MRLTDVVATSVGDRNAPAAALALAYAEQIDTATHVALGLMDALDELHRAAQLADEQECGADDAAVRAWRKVASALSSVTVVDALGPKLLAALDALLLTPKARAAAGQAIPTKPVTSALAGLRDEEDEVAKRRARKSG